MANEQEQVIAEFDELAKLKELADKAEPGEWCPDWTYSAIRHVQRNCDIECSKHADTDEDCPSFGRYDGPYVAYANPDRIKRLIERTSRAESALAQCQQERDQLRKDLTSAEESLEAQAKKYADCPHLKGDSPCACSYDRPSDVCGIHAPQLKQCQQERDQAREWFHKHTKAVGAFLRELYAIMVDPLDDAPNVTAAMRMLKDSALDSRERLNGLPAIWQQDSSLETWFPLTAKELKQCQQELAAAQRELAGLQAQRTTLECDIDLRQRYEALRTECDRLREILKASELTRQDGLITVPSD